MVVNAEFWQGKRVLLTGHTGFKGGWLSLWLQQLGAELTGLALPPPKTPSLWELARVDEGMASHFGDIRDLENVRRIFRETEPEVVFHLAAQPLVRASYADPVNTYATNVMGTLHILEAVRESPSVRSCVLVTTDKVYKNRESMTPYREDEPLGGHDPYSSSKACCEIVAESYIASYFSKASSKARVATARAGNVLGGGDFGSDRLIPDIVRAWSQGEAVTLRYPQAVRPWQHVLEPLAGYLQLAEALYEDRPEFAHAFNFGPDEFDMRTVGEVVSELSNRWPNCPGFRVEPSELHETGLLRLDSSRARERLHWRPRWSLSTCLEATLEWHRAWSMGQDMREFTLRQVARYSDTP
jgi:CDP-glucose 4,6-dehydratase